LSFPKSATRLISLMAGYPETELMNDALEVLNISDERRLELQSCSGASLRSSTSALRGSRLPSHVVQPNRPYCQSRVCGTSARFSTSRMSHSSSKLRYCLTQLTIFPIALPRGRKLSY
jgi:hypothetical protein